jgi:hypothetical protein
MEHMSDELGWLQRWFLSHCDGEWEHGFAITIETLDNPGWNVLISLEGTELEAVPFDPIRRESSKSDWIDCKVVGKTRSFVGSPSPNYLRFDGSGGPTNLADIIRAFQEWAEKRR